MFDIYKEMILELQGIKPQKKLDKKREYIGPEDERPVFSTKYKVLIIVLGILYLCVAALGGASAVMSQNFIALSKYIILVPIDIAAMILCLFRKRKMQKVSLALIILFVIINFGTTMIL